MKDVLKDLLLVLRRRRQSYVLHVADAAKVYKSVTIRTVDSDELHIYLCTIVGSFWPGRTLPTDICPWNLCLQ